MEASLGEWVELGRVNAVREHLEWLMGDELFITPSSALLLLSHVVVAAADDDDATQLARFSVVVRQKTVFPLSSTQNSNPSF